MKFNKITKLMIVLLMGASSLALGIHGGGGGFHGGGFHGGGFGGGGRGFGGGGYNHGGYYGGRNFDRGGGFYGGVYAAPFIAGAAYDEFPVYSDDYSDDNEVIVNDYNDYND